IGQDATECSTGCAERGTGQWHQEDHTNQRAPQRAVGATARRWMEQLIELDVTVWLLHRDDGIAQLDKVLLLHVQQLLTHFFSFFFGRKCDNHEIAHIPVPFAVASLKAVIPSSAAARVSITSLNRHSPD